MVACGKERGMNGNMHGDAREKRGVEEKAEVEMIWTKNGAARCWVTFCSASGAAQNMTFTRLKQNKIMCLTRKRKIACTERNFSMWPLILFDWNHKPLLEKHKVGISCWIETLYFKWARQVDSRVMMCELCWAVHRQAGWVNTNPRSGGRQLTARSMWLLTPAGWASGSMETSTDAPLTIRSREAARGLDSGGKMGYCRGCHGQEGNCDTNQRNCEAIGGEKGTMF